jgi:PAS domain S-box-containing protein
VPQPEIDVALSARQDPSKHVATAPDSLSDYFAGSASLVALLDRSGGVLACSRSLQTGRVDGPAPRQFADFFNPEARESIARALADVVAGGTSACLEAPGPRPDGSRGWFHLSLGRVTGRTGIATSAIVTDITERKREEERLRRSESMMVDTQGVAHLGVWEWDITQPHASWSPELYRIYGLDPKTHVPTYEDYLMRVHPDDRQRVKEATENVFHQLQPYSHDERIHRADGTLRYLHTWAFPGLDDAGRLVRLTGVCQDITDRKLAENALAEHAAELARSNAQLEQFARVIAHDLQEPLRAIASFAQLLSVENKGRLGGFSDEAIEFIVEGVHRMKSLIVDLLEYSRITGQDQRRQVVSLSDALARARDELSTQLAEAGAAIKAEPLPAVMADPIQLHLVFKELLANAVRFRGERRPEIALRASCQNGMVETVVQDNGPGIDPRYHERIFALFQRLNAEAPGTGIGLAQCKSIVERHGGRIWVQSWPGEGAAFHFTLPAAPNS